MEKKHLIMIMVIIIILVAPLIIYQGEGYFGGSDSQAEEAISQSGYIPWFNPIWEPPSQEIESLIFALQAALGAGIIGYFLGYYSMKRKMKSK